MTDEELAKFLGLENVSDLYDGISGKRGLIWIDTHDGQWMRYDEKNSLWQFQPYVDGDD